MKAESTPRVSYQQRVTTFLDSRRGKMFGFAEVAALAGSCFVLLMVLLSYLYFFVPARSRVASLNEDKTRLQSNLKTLQGVVNNDRNTKDQVDRIAASLTDFESTHLPSSGEGKLEFYEELNQLIVKNGLRNTSGPTYTPLEPTGGPKQVGARTTTTKWQSFYPGIAVLVTIEGQYQDLRRFIRDLERSKQFTIINQVELQRANENEVPVAAEGSAEGTPATSSTPGSIISLQLNLATYFQRDNANTNGSQPQD